MKTVKGWMIYSGALVILGAVMFFFGYCGGNDLLRALGIGLMAGGVVKEIQFLVLRRSPEKLKAYELKRSEERTTFIAHKSALCAYTLGTVGAVLAAFAFAIAGKAEIAEVLCYMACAQLLLYSVSYMFFSRKY